MTRDRRNAYRVEAPRAGYVAHQDLVVSPGLRSVPVGELSRCSLHPTKYTKLGNINLSMNIWQATMEDPIYWRKRG